MGRLSANMLAELKKPNPVAFPIFYFTHNSVTYRYSETGLIQSGVGLYEPRVTAWGAITRGVSQRQNSLEFGTTSVTLQDEDQMLTKLIFGPYGNSFRNSPAVIQLVSPNVGSSDWFTGYSGRIDSYAQDGPLSWTLSLSPNDLPLQRESLPKARITASDWPNSPVSVRDEYAPILYGNIASANVSNTGAVVCPFVDQGGFRYMVAAGWMKAVDTVYVAGVPTAASNYTIEHPLVNGRRYTIIKFNASQGQSQITADVRGCETAGDGSGTLIEDPPTILKHVIVNWIYGDWKTGSWLADSTAPVDTTSFGTTYFSDRGIKACLYVNKKRRGQDVVNDMLKSMEAKAYWLANGKVAFAIDDFSAWSYPTNVFKADEMNPAPIAYAANQLIDSVEGQWMNFPNGGYQMTLRVADLRSGETAPEQVGMPFAAAFLL